MSDILDFELLKSNAQEIEAKLIKGFEPKPKFAQDERFWKPKKNNLTNSIYAEIRFMQPYSRDGFTHITKYFHGWQNSGNKKNFYVECPKTYGQDCPICNDVARLWQENDDSTKLERSKKNKKTNYTSVIYVVKDPEEPENEGKFFFYTYGKTIYDRIQEKMAPQNEFEDIVNVFNIMTGCTLKLKGSINEGGYMNYTKSEWMSPGPIKQNEEELKQLWTEYTKSGLDLNEFLDPSKIKSYDEIHDLYCKYENFGRSIDTRVSNNESRKIETSQKEFLGFDNDDVNDIKTDTSMMNLETVLDDSIPDFNDINDIPDASSNIQDDVDDFIASLSK